MPRQLLLLVCALVLICLSTFLGAEPVQAAPTVEFPSLVNVQKFEVEPKIDFSKGSASKEIKNLEFISRGDVNSPRLESYQVNIVQDGYNTGRRLGYRAGTAFRNSTCINFDFNCFVER